MNTETIHTITAACLLIAAGILFLPSCLRGALWWNPSVCTIVFAILLSVYTVLRYLFRFHPAIIK